jgi:hypothetical protein
MKVFKNLFFLTFLVISFGFQSYSQSYIGKWERPAASGGTEYIELTTDSLIVYTYSAPSTCYIRDTYACFDSGSNTFTLSFPSGNQVVNYTINGSSMDIMGLFGLPQTFTYTQSIINYSSLPLCGNFGPQLPYIGQWTNTDTTYLEITTDSIFVYDFFNGCYNSQSFTYLDDGNGTFTFNIAGQTVTAQYVLTSNNTNLAIMTAFDTANYTSNNFDITQFNPCSGSDTSNNYIGKWKDYNSTPNRYVEFTSDSVFIYQFDSTNCYSKNSLTCVDAGNNQLTIATVINVPYQFSANGDTLSLSITGLGDFDLISNSFDVSSWVECTYNWKCDNTGNCVDVGLNNGTHHSEADCQAVCQDTTSIAEYALEYSVYPNPFSDFVTLELSQKIKEYQLIDELGRVIFRKRVQNSKEYLYKSNLSSGIYVLQLMSKNQVVSQKLIIE